MSTPTVTPIAAAGSTAAAATSDTGLSLAQQMLADGSLPDKPVSAPPMRAVVAAASTMNPDAEAKTQQLAQQAGMGVDLTRANPQAAQQRALANELDARQIEFTNPILAAQLRDPNFAGVAHDDLDSLTRIEQGAAAMRALTPWESFRDRYIHPAFQKLMEYPLTRMGIDAVGGTAGMIGNVGSFFGWHGSGPTKENLPQRIESGLSPAAADLNVEGKPDTGNALDAVVRNVAPMIPAMLATGGTAAIADALKLSDTGAKVLTALSVGSLFSASQGGETYTQMAAAGRPDARHAADLVAGINLVPNVAMGLTDFVPVLKRNPLLASIGIGGVTGATGQLAQNVVTGQPWSARLGAGALQGAAVMGGMHLGMSLLEPMSDVTDAVESSKLMKRSPEAGQRLLDAEFAGDSSLRIPAQDFVNYFAEKKLDPALAAHQVGVTNLEEAAAAGSDLEIPRANFFGKLDPEHQRGLAADVIDPATELTARQREAGRQELEQWAANGGVEKLAAEYAQADAETQATPEWQKVKSDLKQRYVEAGENETAAEDYSTLHANAIANLARGAGLKPDELLALHNPKIVEGEAPETVLYQGGAEGLTDGEKEALAKVPARGWKNSEDLLEYRDELKSLVDKGLVETRRNEEWGTDFSKVQQAPGAQSKRASRNLEAARMQGEFLKSAAEPVTAADPERLLIHNDWGEVGREFTATMGSEPLKPGDIIAENRDGVALKVLSLEGKTSRGSQWYRFRTVDADTARRAGEAVTPNPKGKPASSFPGKSAQSAEGADAESAAETPAAAEPAANPEIPAPEERRGWFRILGPGQYEIGKTKIGDLSTFIHEPAHAYLEMFRDLAGREEASPALKSDFGKIAKWLGATPEEVAEHGFTREQHEQWARANEEYVREGKAPTTGLQRVFHHFAVWLNWIYGRASRLGVELSPEIREVMDRLYAGEEATNRAGQETAKPLFTNPEEAGWTDEEYRNYAEARGIAMEKARTQVAAELNEAAERERTEQFREEKGNIRDAVTQEIDARPDYTAIRSLRKGKLDDGTELTLNRDALVQQFGEDRVKALNQLHRGLYRNDGGTDAETAAELFGYGSGEEMMRALEAAPRRRQAIDAATRDYLTTKYGDVRYDGTLNDRARFAVESERPGILYRELRALKTRLAALEKKTGDAKAAMEAISLPKIEHYQEAARRMIDQKAIADLSPSRYLNASRGRSREAFDALRKGNARAAAKAKNKELLNHFLFREATAARDWADKFESYAKRVQSRGIQQRMGLAGSDYREQFNWLLARYGLSGPMQRPERSLRDWAEEAYAKGDEPAIAPGILNEGRFADYRSVPLSEVRDLHDALVNVRHLAQREFEMFVQGKQIAFADARAAMVNAARENLKTKPEKIFEENRSAVERVADAAQRADALLVRMERLTEELDGGKSGPWHDNLWNLASDAQGDEYALQHSVTHAVTDALASMPDEMRRRLWTEKVTVEGIPEPLTRRRMLSIAFNMGNEGNLDRLQKTFDSFGWDRDAIRRIGGMLTREEWSFVQKAWDSLKPLGERMQELEKRLTGLPPAMVKVTPFKVALDHGTEMDLAGGYYPITMDPRFSQRAIEQDSKETAQNAMQSGYVRATTSRGYTKERTGFGGPLLLDYERVLTSHVAKVAKDLSHREFMLSTQRFLLDTEVRRTLRETLGPAYEAQFMPWLRTIINDRNGGVEQGVGDLSRLMQTARANIVAAEVGLKASTALLQITHAPRMLLYAKPASIGQSLVDFLAHPAQMTEGNRSLSPNEMRARGDNLDRDVRAVLQRPEYQGGYARKAATAARWTLQAIDHLFSHTLWRAAYRDALAKYADLPEEEAAKKAVYEADSAVRLGLGTQAPKDLPAIMRNNDFNKMITTLYGFHNGVYNQLRDNFHQYRYGGGIAKLTYATALTAIVPAVLGALVTGDGPKDDENPGAWAAKRALLFSADTIPFLSSVANYMSRGTDVQFSPIEEMMQKGAKALAEARPGKEDKDWLGIGLDAAQPASALLGVPGSQQAVKTLRYIKRANEGKIQNPNVWDAVAGGR